MKGDVKTCTKCRQTKPFTDLRSDLEKAMDKFFDSEQGKHLCEGTTHGRYLRHRLERTFIEGWTMCEELHRKGGD